MSEPAWITEDDAIFFHGQLIGAFGGTLGIRDLALLQSALQRPRNVLAYENKDIFVLAGAYAHGIVKNHPFVDGNKRVAFTVARVFLGLNGIAFNPPEAETVVMVEGLASGELTQDEFATWVEKHSK